MHHKEQDSQSTIDYRDISVVLQGPIAGKPMDKPEDRHTELCIKSIRAALPGATIILATWKGNNVKELDYDVLVESDDPGPVVMGGATPQGHMGVGSMNGFRQIKGSIDGIRAVRTKYVLRMRNDLTLKDARFVDYFIEYNKLPFDEEYKLLKQRIVVITASNPRRRSKHPFTVSDWFYFGLTEDITNVFDVPLVKKEQKVLCDDGKYHRAYSLYSAEQYLWFGFISKYRKIAFENCIDVSGNNIELSERYLVNNAIMLTARRAGVHSLKYPGAAYEQTPSMSNSGMYTFTEYRQMLNKYANTHLVVIPNPFEALAYFVVYNLRFWVRDKNPKLHDRIRRMVNSKLHKKLDAIPGSRDPYYGDE